MRRRISSFRRFLPCTLTRAWPEIALGLALFLTGVATYSTYNLTSVQRRNQVRTMTASFGGTIHHRLRVFEHGLHNARSFVMSRGGDGVDLHEFSRFVRGLDLEAQVPGLRSLEFVTISQCAGEADLRRRAAMRTSRDTGHETLSDHLDASRFEMYLPVFETGRALGVPEARRRALRGWIRARFEVESLLAEVTADLRRVSGDVGVEVFDGPERSVEHRIFASEAAAADYVRPIGILRKYLANHVWTIRVRPTARTFSASGPPMWALIALIGIASSAWIYLTVRRSVRLAGTLQRSEAMLSLVMDGVPAMISYFGLDQRYVYANRNYERVTGIPRKKIIGMSVKDLLGADFYERFSGHVGRALGGDAVDFEHDLFEIDGVRRVMRGRYIPHRNPQGEICGVVALVHDVTEERAAELKLRAVAAENADLYNEAQAVNRVKDEFLATLSHELRTPLNVILGYSELLLEEDLGEEARGFVESIRRGARAQNQLIADLLDISAIINGKISFSPSPLNLNEVVSGAVEGVSFAAEAKGVTIECDSGLVPLTILGDPTRMQQIVWNLLSNAIKFTPRGGTVAVSVRKATDRFELEVRDTGVGIDADFLPYVFDRFRQEDASRARRFGGLGLGLAIVRHLVEMHGGQIRVTSPGKDGGSTFTVSIPRFELSLRLTEGA